jgi:preprotein translocase subunit SecD
VPRAWVRARRTILSADTVSFLAAAVLYYFAAGDVKGFAFTLGLSTILDLVVVFLFTHPMVSLLSRSSAFGSSRFTGLNALRGAGVASDKETEVARPPRRAGRAKPAAVTPEPEPEPEPAAVAVLDEEDEAGQPEPEPAAAAPERPRTPPKAGTAAERAAARRARMRAEAGESQKGKR